MPLSQNTTNLIQVAEQARAELLTAQTQLASAQAALAQLNASSGINAATAAVPAANTALGAAIQAHQAAVTAAVNALDAELKDNADPAGISQATQNLIDAAITAKAAEDQARLAATNSQTLLATLTMLNQTNVTAAQALVSQAQAYVGLKQTLRDQAVLAATSATYTELGGSVLPGP